MNAVDSKTQFLAALLDAATPLIVGTIWAQRGELPDFTLYEKSGDQAAYLEGFYAELAAMSALAAQARANRERQVMTAEEALEHNAEYAEWQLEIDFVRFGGA